MPLSGNLSRLYIQMVETFSRTLLASDAFQLLYGNNGALVFTIDAGIFADGTQISLCDFDAGVPVALDGESLAPVALIEKLEALAGSYGIDRGIHLGDTVLGTKGRVAFEAPAAITLISTHRELEKLVLSAQQTRIKDSVSAVYGDLIHEGKQLDLACADIEALLTQSQQRVTGTVRFALRPGQIFIEGSSSRHS